jgi:hypothetical protein
VKVRWSDATPGIVSTSEPKLDFGGVQLGAKQVGSFTLRRKKVSLKSLGSIRGRYHSNRNADLNVLRNL